MQMWWLLLMLSVFTMTVAVILCLSGVVLGPCWRARRRLDQRNSGG